eukprot:214587_1
MNVKEWLVCIAYSIGLFSTGMIFAAPGPILSDLEDQYDVSLNTISYIFILRGIGYIVGSAVAGYTPQKYINYAFALSMCLEHVANVMVKYFSNIYELFVIFFIMGCCINGNYTLVTSNVLSIFAKKSKATSRMIMSLMFLSFSIGSLIAPLLIQVSYQIINDYYLSFYVFAGIALPAIVLLIYNPSFDVQLNQKQQLVPDIKVPKKQSLNYNEDGDGSQLIEMPRNKIIIYGCSIFIIFFLGLHVCYGSFISSISRHYLNQTAELSRYIVSVYFAGFVFGRVCSIYISRIWSPLTMIIINLTLLFVSSLILLLALKYYIFVWIATGMYGLGISTLFPCTFNYSRQMSTLNSRDAAILMMGAAIGELIMPPLEGTILHHFGLKYFGLFTFVITVILIVVLLFVVFCNKVFK